MVVQRMLMFGITIKLGYHTVHNLIMKGQQPLKNIVVTGTINDSIS